MTFLLKCPRCGNRMKYEAKGASIAKKRKSCVYCGKSFDVGKAIAEEL